MLFLWFLTADADTQQHDVRKTVIAPGNIVILDIFDWMAPKPDVMWPPLAMRSAPLLSVGARPDAYVAVDRGIPANQVSPISVARGLLIATLAVA